MRLRALPLLFVLGLHSAASAAVGLVHLCQGELALSPTCCCDHAEGGPALHKEHVPGAAEASAAPTRCCDLLEVRPAGASAPVTQARASSLPDLTPAAPALEVAPAQEKVPLAWVRLDGLSHATAPPLFIQHCAYLI